MKCFFNSLNIHQHLEQQRTPTLICVHTHHRQTRHTHTHTYKYTHHRQTRHTQIHTHTHTDTHPYAPLTQTQWHLARISEVREVIVNSTPGKVIQGAQPEELTEEQENAEGVNYWVNSERVNYWVNSERVRDGGFYTNMSDFYGIFRDFSRKVYGIF